MKSRLSYICTLYLIHKINKSTIGIFLIFGVNISDIYEIESICCGEKREVKMNDTLTECLKKIKKDDMCPHVFHDGKGNRIRDIRKSFATALNEAEIEDFRFHDLRHTFASNLVMEGVDLATVRELLGHKSIEMTLRYSHLSHDHKEKAIKTLDKIMQIDTNMDTKGIPAKSPTPQKFSKIN